METLKYTLEFLMLYCITLLIGITLSSCLRENKPLIDVCSDGGWCSNAMYLNGTDNHLLITTNLDDEGIPLISQEEALRRLEEAFGFVELSIVSNLESREYPITGDELPLED